MAHGPEWLPPLVLLEEAHGNWEEYLEHVYQYFKTDFVDSKPFFKGKKLALKRYPLSKGKEATFWHFVSEGQQEEDRLPDLRRCERIRWPRPIIEHPDDDSIKIWENRLNNEIRICLWLKSSEYLVVLADRKGYILPWTAYPVTREHSKRKLQKAYEKYWQGKTEG
jgi:hypothetical protein